ncbi:hypothetical protein V6Z12_D11G247700 [Gossypium hirsutum]
MLKCTNNKLRLCLRISLKAIMKLQGCLSRLVLMYSTISLKAELESFKMEYANARLECNAADERANILASEVIGLEEKVTKFQWETSCKPACRPASKLNQISSSILFILFICNLI